jgi:hypothetical protein
MFFFFLFIYKKNREIMDGVYSRFQGVYFTEADNVLIMDDNDNGNEFQPRLTAGGVHEFMSSQGDWCYLAPSRYEKKSSWSLEDPFGGKVLVGQNVCSEGPVVVTVQSSD